MSTIVFHTTAQPSVESLFTEPLTLRLKLASPPTSLLFHQPPIKPASESAISGRKIGSPELGACNFSEIPEPCPSSPSSSSSCLSSGPSDKSLELCTEDLGNESGCTEIFETNFFSAIPSPVGSPRRLSAIKKADPENFPPPLTTICGGGSLQLRPHREDGRLVIEAVRAPPAYSSFKAERSKGRLWLFFLTEAASAFDPEPLDCQEKPREEEDSEADCLYIEEEVGGEEEEVGGEEEEVEVEEQEVVDADCRGRGVNEKEKKFGVRIGNMEMFARTGRRCTEGGEAAEIRVIKGSSSSRLLDWGPFLVATS